MDNLTSTLHDPLGVQLAYDLRHTISEEYWSRHGSSLFPGALAQGILRSLKGKLMYGVAGMTNQRTYPFCEHDHFPLVTIDGRSQCAAEYLDRCLGLKRVVDMVQRDKVTFYVFEDGHELPLLCFCCAEPLTGFDLEESRRRIRGRRLEQMSMAQVALDGGDDRPQFRLEFSKRGLFSHALVIPLSPEVAARMRHPDTCPHKPQPRSLARRRGKKP